MLRVVAFRLVALALISTGTGTTECDAGRSPNDSIYAGEIADEATESKKSSGREYLVEYSDYVDVPNFKKHESGRFDYYDVAAEASSGAGEPAEGPIVINKCCSWNHYFDVDSLRCVRFPDETWNSTESEFFVNKVANKRNETGYSFVESTPSCGKLWVLSIRTVSEVEVDSRGVTVDGGEAFGHYCIDENPNRPRETVVLTCDDPERFCRSHGCFRKCCPLGESYELSGRRCRKADGPFTPNFFDLTTLARNDTARLSHFGIRFGDACELEGKYLLEDDLGETSYLGSNGELYVPMYEKRFSSDEFCIEYVQTKNSCDTCTFLCFPKNRNNFKNSSLQFFLMSLGFILSCMFLMLTFLVYLFSPKSRNLHGKTLMCYIASLFTAYLCLAVAELESRELRGILCTVLGHAILFSFLAAFFWLNVMSFDIWKTFRSNRSVERSKADRRKKLKFLMYSAYAWTFPSVITAACALLDQSSAFPYDCLRPGIGEESCWFSKNKKGIHLFFTGPISVVIACNVIFYVQTAWKIWKVRSEIGKIEKQRARRLSAHKERFTVNGKLFIVMGITWSLEIISFFAPHPIWYITDAANALHGVFIFVVFVLKKKVLQQVSQQLRLPMKRMRQSTAADSEEPSNRKNFQESKTCATGTSPPSGNDS